MTDNLPPLPEGDIKYSITDSTMRRMECDAHSDAQMQAYARAALAQAQSCVPAERIEELEILAARWTHLEYMYGRGIAPATMAHYIGRPERLDYSAQLHREHGAIAASPQPQPVQPKAFYTYIDITLTEEESALLRDTLGEGDQTSPVRLQIGNGHGGYGLYASSAEYPEEGAVRICNVSQANPEQAAQPWMPIETAPKDGTRVLLVIDHGQWGDKVWTGLWADGWSVSYGKPLNSPTHWMPLPAAPQPKD